MATADSFQSCDIRHYRCEKVDIGSKTESKHPQLQLLGLVARVGPHIAGGLYGNGPLAFIARKGRVEIYFYSLSFLPPLSFFAFLLPIFFDLEG